METDLTMAFPYINSLHTVTFFLTPSFLEPLQCPYYDSIVRINYGITWYLSLYAHFSFRLRLRHVILRGFPKFWNVSVQIGWLSRSTNRLLPKTVLPSCG